MKKKYFSIISGAWCLVTLFGFANFLAFYYAGYKSKSKKYIFIGHIYLVLKLASAVIKLSFFSSLISFLSIAGYFFGIIFAFATIKAFYKRLKLLDLLDPLILNSKIKMIYTLDNQALDEFVKENEHFFEQTKPFSDAATKNNSYSQPYVSKADENEPAPELASDINDEMKVAAAYAIAGLVSDEELNADYILPAAFDPRVKDAVAAAVAEAARKSGVARI